MTTQQPGDQALQSSQWTVARTSAEASKALSDLVMAWARDSETGEPRYIFELGKDRQGSKCRCNCYSCGLPLTAVNAAKAEFRNRPHFRHPNGAPREDCLVLTARAAALAILRQEDTLELPACGRTAKVLGLSGEYYNAWVNSPPERVRIKDFKALDTVSALLTLDDGRQLKVVLTGSLVELAGSEEADSPVIPTILLTVDDPAVAAMAPDELRKRLQLLVDQAQWCAHWQEANLLQQAAAMARAQAEDALDWLDADALPDLAPDARRETLLHLLAKDILEQERRICLPDLPLSVAVPMPWSETVRTQGTVPGGMIMLEEVRLEERMGQIRPDVVALTLESGPWPAAPLLIEITVTNPITAERLQRIRQLNLPTLEIDISRMGGKVTKTEFAQLVVDESAGKRWVHHPGIAQEADRLRHAFAEYPELPEATTADWCNRYLGAVEHHSNLRALSDTDKADLPQQQYALRLVKACAAGLADCGYPEATDDELFRSPGSILDRLLSIKHDNPVGYRLDTTWQVLNAIHCEHPPHTQWQTLYLTALKVYKPPLSEKHAEKVVEWRAAVLRSLEAGEEAYLRNRKFDRLLGLLFPEMANLLSKPLPAPTSTAAPPAQASSAPNYVFQAHKLSHLYGTGFLTGRELEDWIRKHPDAAKRFYGG